MKKITIWFAIKDIKYQEQEEPKYIFPIEMRAKHKPQCTELYYNKPPLVYCMSTNDFVKAENILNQHQADMFASTARASITVNN